VSESRWEGNKARVSYMNGKRGIRGSRLAARNLALARVELLLARLVYIRRRSCTYFAYTSGCVRVCVIVDWRDCLVAVMPPIEDQGRDGMVTDRSLREEGGVAERVVRRAVVVRGE